MNELTLTELDMGSTTPRILRASKPSIDYRGKTQTLYSPRARARTGLSDQCALLCVP